MEVPSSSKGELYCFGEPGDWTPHAVAIWLGQVMGGWLRYFAVPTRLPVPQHVYAPLQENVATCLTATPAEGPLYMEQDRHSAGFFTSMDRAPLTDVARCRHEPGWAPCALTGMPGSVRGAQGNRRSCRNSLARVFMHCRRTGYPAFSPGKSPNSLAVGARFDEYLRPCVGVPN